MEFKEQQKFSKIWLWLLLFGVLIISLININIIFFEKDANTPIFGLLLMFIFISSLAVLFWKMELRTRINQEGIQMEYAPFLKKSISWTSVKSAEVINYGFVGGWGIRYWTKYGTVYNTKGNKGLYLILKNGKKLCIGTQREKELANFIQQINKT